MLTIHLITDGKAGDRVQCLGVAEALAAVRPARLVEQVVLPRAPYVWFLPYGPPDPRDGAVLAPPYPDIAIASGRRAVASLRVLKRRSPNTVTAFMKDPRTGNGAADLIWVPEHDRLRGPNVFVTDTSPHRLSPASLAAERHQPTAALPPCAPGQRRLLVLLGGPTSGFAYGMPTADRLAGQISAAIDSGFSVWILPSRRTPQAFVTALCGAIGSRRYTCWDGRDPNPYPTAMATADAIVAPADSHNMVSESLAPGVPVFVFNPEGPGTKLTAFVNAQKGKGRLMELPDRLEPSLVEALRPSAQPVDSTPVIAQAILALLDRAGLTNGR